MGPPDHCGDEQVTEDAEANPTVRRDQLAERRKALGLTQEQLADLLNVGRTTVARWERGEAEPLPWLRPKLAKALKFSPERIEALLARPGSARPGGTSPVVPRQLPAAAADFTGRAAELRTLTSILDQASASNPGTVVISAIGGTAGVGKTALALHWAHLVAGRFADGQLYVNLRGFDPAGAPTAPDVAIRGFLGALGVPPGRTPADPQAQAGLYRSLLADRKMLVVLDNARDEQQVRPLLSASPGSLVLVTSRNQLAGLAVADGARLLSLDVLSQDEAVSLLTARIGAAKVAAEPQAISEIARLCACLPLALAVAAARAVTRPGFPLAALAAELREAARRLDVLDAGDPAASVRAVFSWSYRQLGANAGRTFRLLGLYPGPDISLPAAASLAGIDQLEARRLLDELTRAHVLAEHVPGRFAFHDLLRVYAADQARASDSETERKAAVGRVLDHYLHTADRGALLLFPGHKPVTLATPMAGSAPERLADYRHALAWFEAERQVLLDAVILADTSGFDTHAWQLPWAMSAFLETGGHLREWTATLRTALAAATRLGDTAGQAASSRLLAAAWSNLGDHDQAADLCETSLELYQRLGDRLGEARVRQSLGVFARRQGRYTDADSHNQQALRLYQAIGNKAGEAMMLNNIAGDYLHVGDYQQARACCLRALTLNAEVGYRRLDGAIWDNLGVAEQHAGNLDQANACFQRSLGIHRELGDRQGEAENLVHLGDMLQAAGKLPRAREAWQQALAILEDDQRHEADEVRVKLASLAATF
jgi:tetratricopeptide (TPR) repeat protein/transcriptional regulator with XRE-family HTH domain